MFLTTKKISDYVTEAFWLIVCMVFLVVIVGINVTYGQHVGPVHVPRDLSNASIHEGSVQMTAGYKTNINSTLGQLSANYSWFGGFMSALGSMYNSVDPKWLSYKSGQQMGMYQNNLKPNEGRLYAGVKKLGGTDVTDTPKLGEVCGKKPGDPYWAAYWRPGNVENPPAYQTWHSQFDCYCRCGEMIACPIKDYAGYNNWHQDWGGPATHHILCEECFGYEAHIRKHDYYVGKDIKDHAGYPVDAPGDLGYQECLRQSVESYGSSMTGGTPNDDTLFGI
jgi:hypothetical protein